MRVGIYFARIVAAWFFALAVIASALLVAWSSLIPADLRDLPSPWSLVGPLFLLATFVTWSRAQCRGELTAAASGGVSRRAMVVPILALGGVLQLLFAIPPGRMPHTSATAVPVQRSVDGALFLAQRSRGVLLLSTGELAVVGKTLPASFKPAPANPQRYRRQAFFTLSPRLLPQEPLDPWLWRWLYILAVIGVPACLMQLHRSSAWWFGLLPLLLPLLVL